MPFSVSGRIGAGATDALEQVLERRMQEQIRQDTEKQRAADLELRRQGIDLQKETLAGAKADREADNLRQQRVVDLQLKKDADLAAEKATERNRASDAAAVFQMPGMSTEAKMNELRTSALRGGGDPLKVIEGLQKVGTPPRLHQVTVPGPGGRPMTKWIGDDEAQAGVTAYREPDKPTRENLTPGQKYQATRGLRNDFVRETAGAKVVSQQYAMMKSAWDEIQSGKVPAGSEAMLVIFNKILDPNSVVRESEYFRSMGGQPLMEKMEQAWNRVFEGGNLKPERLKTYMQLAAKFVNDQNAAAKDSKQQIDAIADEFSLNKTAITRDYADVEEDEPDKSDSINLRDHLPGGGGAGGGGGRLGYGDLFPKK